MALTGAGLIYHLHFDFRGPVRHDLYCSAQLHVGFKERAERGMLSVRLGSWSWWRWRWRQGQLSPASPRAVCQVPNAKEMRNFCLCSSAFHLNKLITFILMRSKSVSELRLVQRTITHWRLKQTAWNIQGVLSSCCLSISVEEESAHRTIPEHLHHLQTALKCF